MDLNTDGFNDILSGSYSRSGQPMAGLFQVLWGKADGSFKKAEELKGTDDKPLVIPAKNDKDMQEVVESICTRPTAVDWDGDGDLDLVVGNFAGRFWVFLGEGGGKFAPTPQPLKTGDDPLQISGAHGDPFLVDWDKDGDLDLLSGSANGGVQWAENTAGAKKTPVLKRFVPLIAPPKDMSGERRPAENEEPSVATRIWVTDLNGDGKLDIVMGDNVTLLSPAKGLSDAEFEKRFTEWKTAYAAAQQAMSSAPDAPAAEARQQELMKLYEQRGEFISADRTGFVWVYLQK